MQLKFSDLKLGKEVSKYRLIVIITLLLICTVNIFLIVVSPEEIVVLNSPLSKNETVSKPYDDYEFNTNNTPSQSSGLKVEIVAFSSILSFDSGDNHFNNFINLNKIYSKKGYSITSQSKRFISKALHFSPLITKLQI